MPEDIQIRQVHVEFLRPGPPHNQLLSPLTQYLAISGDAGAGVVTLPYEHAEFERRLKELRYEAGDPADRREMLHTIGVDMGKILGAVPGVAGALMTDPHQLGTLIHLRLTLSASELALLPFEVAKVPVSATSTTENWLSIQTRPPVCVTRNIRTVSPEGVTWPDRPRVLFVAGDPAEIPYAEHRQVLLEAIQPFQYPARDDLVVSHEGAREQCGDLLTILVNPTLTDVFRECRDTRYTHVHILTHGDLNENARESYGLVLRGADNGPEVVSGEQFASALTSVSEGRIHRPTVVTVSSCDSGNVGTVIIPGASFAHALHQAGIPLVVASQFPLSKEGSVPLAATMYQGLLWGANPLVLLQQVRAELHARYTATWHDWASLVVYEALPQALDDQLDKVQYSQARRAINAALERIDRAVLASRTETEQESVETLEAALNHALERLPLDGQYGVECLGLRASSRKRLAQAAYTLAGQTEGEGAWRDPYELLDQAWCDYDLAVRGLLINEGRPIQRVATLHWVLVQFVSLAAILGREIDDGRWTTARLSADFYCDHPSLEERAWAHGSLAELWLIRLARPDLSREERQTCKDRAIQHAQELAQLYPWGDEFPVKSTRRQFKRYVEWWGRPDFGQGLEARGIRRLAPWEGELGLLEAAERLVSVLHRNAPSSPSGRSTSGSNTGKTPAGPLKKSPVPLKSTRGESRGATPAAGATTPDLKAPVSKSRRPPSHPSGVFTVDMLPAGHGDSLWIEYGEHDETHRWLADCGTQQTATELLRRVEALPENERFLELFVMSHIDSDHIGGALPFFKAVKRGLTFGDVWFNGWRHISGRLGARQGEMFSTAIQDFELPWNHWRDGAAIAMDADNLTCELRGGMKLTLLSPSPSELKKLAPTWVRELKRYGLEPGTRVDYSRFLKGTPSTSTDVDELADAPFSADAGLPNGTSIALLAEFKGSSVLLAADAHAPVLAQSIRTLLRKRGTDRLKVGAFKVSHHGSQYNVSTELIELLECRRYLISTNGEHFCHPDRQAIARIIKYGGPNPELHFNYRSRYNEVWGRPDLQEKYGYRAIYPEQGQVGKRVALLGEPAAEAVIA